MNNSSEDYAQCPCGSKKWRADLPKNRILCLKCYKEFTIRQFKVLGNKGKKVR